MAMARMRLRRFFRHGFLPQLLAFEASVRLGSVTRAAESLCLAQPTVSCMLRKLADAMGGPVTTIRDRRVVPTPLGEDLLLLAHDVMAALERHEQRREPGAGYDRVPPPADPPDSPWPSPFRPERPSLSRPRASPWPPAKTRPGEADGAS
jgi:DNA-binding transcriptional LysR family regulator